MAPSTSSTSTALSLPWVITAVAVAFAVGTQCASGDRISSVFNTRSKVARGLLSEVTVPEKALVVRQAESLVLENVPSPTEANASTVSSSMMLFT